MTPGVNRIRARSATIATAVQPDYARWSAVRTGMARAKVESLLGPPLTGREQRPHVQFCPPYVAYGFVSYPALPSKWAMRFTLGYDRDGRVFSKSDPFGGGTLSRSGRPSKPRLISPQPSSRLCHFPRLLDVRWCPASGVYPILYDVQIGLADPLGGPFHDQVDMQQYGQPYALLEFPGANRGRIRVRGCNAIGIGPWSEFAEFSFAV